jgi:hypothetical protein
MLIRSKIEREGGTVVPFGRKGEPDFREYHFKPSGKDGHVAEVGDELDSTTLLAITEGYEKVGSAPAAAKPARLTAQPKKDPAAFLISMDRAALVVYAAERFPAVKLDESHSEEQVRNYLKGLLTKE